MRRTLGVLGLAAGALSLAGCWPVPGADANRSGHNRFESALNADTVDGLTEQWRWTAPLGDLAGVVVSSTGVHVGSKCVTSTLHPATGAVIWEALTIDDPVGVGCDQTLGDQRAGDPYVVGQQVAGSYGSVIQLHTPNFMSTFANRRFDVATGEVLSSGGGFLVARRGEVEATTTSRAFAPAAAEMELTVGGRTFMYHAVTWGSAPFAPTGFTLGTDKLFNVGPAILATAPGTVSFGEGVRAYSITDARPGCGPATVGFPAPGQAVPVECPLWATPTDGAATIPVLSPDGTMLFTRTTAGTLYAIDTATGAVQWTATGLGNAGVPALADGTLFVPTGDGHVLLFEAGGCGAPTCAPDSPTGMDTGTGTVVSAVIVAGDVVYATSGGEVHASGECAGGDCPVAWHGPGFGRPVVSNGQLYVPGSNNTVIAYGLG